jgi:hypothetical protein
LARLLHGPCNNISCCSSNSSLVPTICGSQPRGSAGQTDTVLLKGVLHNGWKIFQTESPSGGLRNLARDSRTHWGSPVHGEPRGGVRPGGNEPMFPSQLRRQDVSFLPYSLHILTRTPAVPCDRSHNNHIIHTTHLKSGHATNRLKMVKIAPRDCKVISRSVKIVKA